MSIEEFSNPKLVVKKAKAYLGKNVVIALSTRKGKKYMVKNKDDKWIHFGALGYEDYTKHKDKNRQLNYLARATRIKGNWRDNKYSPNNLSINILW